ncbi:MAG: DNA primase family protein [Armatimonadota bacterium]|jgi:putative DNA primase/helicase
MDVTTCPEWSSDGRQSASSCEQDERDALLDEALQKARSGDSNGAIRWLARQMRGRGHNMQDIRRASRELVQRLDPDRRPGPAPERVPAHLEAIKTLFTGRLRWCPERKTWLRWTGKCWQTDYEEQVRADVHEALRQEYAGRYTHPASEEDRKRALARLNELEADRYWDKALELFKGHDGVLTQASELDADPWLLNTPSGVLDLRTGELREQQPEDLLSRITAAEYDPQAQCPLFEAFLRQILPHNGLVEYMQAVLGMALIGANRPQELYILHGGGRNGKSTLLNVLQAVLGDYAGPIPRDAVLTRRQQQDAARVSLAACEGIRFGVLDELADGATLSPVAVKDLTSDNPMKARALYENYRDIRLSVTPFIATNHKPAIPEQTEGTWRRVRLIPFTFQVAEESVDPQMQEKLLQEAVGILRWLVDGCRRALEHGLQMPPVVAEATGEYRTEEDALAEFIDACCVTGPAYRAVFRDLYAAYQQWCDENGVERALTKKAFSRLLEQRGVESRQARVDGQKCQLCHGIGLHGVRDVRDLGQFQKVPVLSLHGQTFQKQPLSRTSRTPEASEPLFDALPETSCDAADPFWDGHEEPDCEPALEDDTIQAARALLESGGYPASLPELCIVDCRRYLESNLRDAVDGPPAISGPAIDRLRAFLDSEALKGRITPRR